MKPDVYTKIILTVIALLLLVMVTRQEVQPVRAAAMKGAHYKWYVEAMDHDTLDPTIQSMDKDGCDLKAAVPYERNGFTQYVVFITSCQP
jgi:hypothetical protein